MQKIRVFKTPIKQGNSLVIPLTRELAKLGYVPDTQICVEISLIPSDFHVLDIKTFDPSFIGEKVSKSIQQTAFTEPEIKALIRTYDSDPDHIEAIYRYILGITDVKKHPL